MIAPQVDLPLVDPLVGPSPPPNWHNAYLSVSRLKLFEECPLAFYYRYVDKPEKLAGLAEPQPAEFGTVLHAALEHTYRWIVETEYAGPFPVEVLLEAYRQVWGASGLSSFEIYQEGRAILRRYAADTGSVDHLRVLAVEVEFNLLVAPGGVRLVTEAERASYHDMADHYVVNGYIDRIDRVDAETVEVIDYKSGWLLYTGAEVAADLQLSIYALAAAELFPWARQVKLGFQMLRHGVRQPAERTVDALLAAREYVAVMGVRSETGPYPPRLNSHCDGCAYKRGCAAYQTAVTKKIEMPAVRTEDLPAVAEEYERLTSVSKAVYAKKERLGAVLREAVAKSGREALELGRLVVRVEQPTATGYQARAIVDLFRQAGVDPSPALVVDPGALLALVDRVEADRSVAPRVRELLRVRVAAKSGKIPQKPKVDVRRKSR